MRRKRRRGGGRQQLAHRLEYLALRAVARLLRALPLAPSAAAVGWLWRVFGPMSKRQARVKSNLELAFPGASEDDLNRISSAQWDNLGRTFAESFSVDRIIGDPDRMQLLMSAELERLLAEPGRGAVFVSLHTANWEIAAYPVRRTHSAMGLYRRLSNPLSDRFVLSTRSQVFDGGLLSQGLETPKHVMRWLRAGNAVAILADMREQRGIAVTFFGHRTASTPFPAMLARRLDVPLIAARVIRLPGSRFKIEAVQIPVPRTADTAADVRAATQAYLDQFETWIRDRPGEWMWVQDRWRPVRHIAEPTPRPGTADLPDPR